MQVKDKIMYHYHKQDHYDSMWKVNNEIIVDQNFNSYFGTILTKFETTVTVSDNSLQTFDRILNYYLKEENLEKIDRELLIRLLRESKRIISNTNVYIRELALEEIRIKYFSELPSRLHSIWVCEESQLDFWKDNLNGDLELLKLELSGTLFHSSDAFLPPENINVSEIKKEAKRYWTPNFQTEEEKLKSEYLFQGKVKIIEKMNKARY